MHFFQERLAALCHHTRRLAHAQSPSWFPHFCPSSVTTSPFRLAPSNMILLSRLLSLAPVSCLSSSVCVVDLLRGSLFILASLLWFQAVWSPLPQDDFSAVSLVGAAPTRPEEEVDLIESLCHRSTFLIVRDFQNHCHFPTRLCLSNSVRAKAACVLAQAHSGFQSALQTSKLSVLLL